MKSQEIDHIAESDKKVSFSCSHEDDLISRQAAIELCDWYDNPSLHDDLEKLPSAQPEIIKCKDCRHYKIDHPKANGYHCCYRCHNIFPMKETDFCSKAERRTE